MYTTNEIYLEPVENITKEDCINTFMRFRGSRSTSQSIYRENLTPFIGARLELELRRLLLNASFKDLINIFSANTTLIGLRYHLGRHMLDDFVYKNAFKQNSWKRVSKLSTKAFKNLPIQFEAILISLPHLSLRAPSNDINDLLALTLGHFITGRSILAMS